MHLSISLSDGFRGTERCLLTIFGASLSIEIAEMSLGCALA